MKPRLHALAFALFAVLSTGTSAADMDVSKVNVKTDKLSDSLYMLTGAGGNLGVSVGKDSLFLVDDQYEQMTPKIKAALTALSAKPVRFVINTHWHFDHTGGNENFGKGDAIIVAHENVRKRMSTHQAIEFLGMSFEPSPEKALPIVTFQSDLSFHMNGEDIRVFHVANGHTDGDAIVHFTKSNVVHMGDIFFNGLYPFIDTYSGGAVDGVIAASDKVLAMGNDNTRIIPGHGKLANKAELKSYRDMLATISQRIKAMIKEGKTLDQVIAAKPSADFDAKWGKGFIPPDKFIDMLYKNLLK